MAMGGKEAEPPTPAVVLLTDVGRDVNDMLALQTLALHVRHHQRAHFAGVITTGGDPKVRAGIARAWLRHLGFRDSEVPVAFSRAKGQSTAYIPPGFKLPKDAALFSSRESASTDLLLSLARTHKKALHIVVTSPLTALADAVSADREGLLKNIGGIYIQGQAQFSGSKISPSHQANNLSEDLPAARVVFNELQAAVPFHFVGMHTALAVPLTRDDFQRWDRKLQEMNVVGAESSDSLSMLNLVRFNLESLRKQNPELLYQVCNVPVERRNEHEWFDDVQELVVPYDALTVLRLLSPELFLPNWHEHHSACGEKEGEANLVDIGVTHLVLTETIHAAMCMIVDWRETIKVLLVTDVGRDLDDALALQTLAAHVRGGEGDAELVGVVTCGGNTKLRAAIARGWLRMLGFHDRDVSVAFARPKGRKAVLVPPGFPAPNDAALFSSKQEGATELILRLAEQHQGALRVIVIGAMTPLADAYHADKDGLLKGVGGLFIQGHPLIYGEGAAAMLKPNEDVLNIKEDMDAAVTVFEELQAHVPFHFVGQFAGGRMTLTRQDLAMWDRQLAESPVLPGTSRVCMADLARESLAMLHANNPEVAYHRYNVAEAKRNNEEWYGDVKTFPVLHDAAVVLRLTAPEFFLPLWYGAHSVCGGVPDEEEDWNDREDELVNLVDIQEAQDKLVSDITASFLLITQVASQKLDISNVAGLCTGTPAETPLATPMMTPRRTSYTATAASASVAAKASMGGSFMKALDQQAAAKQAAVNMMAGEEVGAATNTAISGSSDEHKAAAASPFANNQNRSDQSGGASSPAAASPTTQAAAALATRPPPPPPAGGQVTDVILQDTFKFLERMLPPGAGAGRAPVGLTPAAAALRTPGTPSSLDSRESMRSGFSPAVMPRHMATPSHEEVASVPNTTGRASSAKTMPRVPEHETDPGGDGVRRNLLYGATAPPAMPPPANGKKEGAGIGPEASAVGTSSNVGGAEFPTMRHLLANGVAVSAVGAAPGMKSGGPSSTEGPRRHPLPAIALGALAAAAAAALGGALVRPPSRRSPLAPTTKAKVYQVKEPRGR